MNEYKNPHNEQHSNGQDEMTIPEEEHELLRRFFEYILYSDRPYNTPVDMAKFHDYYIQWAKKKTLDARDAKYKTLSSKEFFWHHVMSKIGKLPKVGMLYLATIQDQIFQYFNKLSLESEKEKGG